MKCRQCGEKLPQIWSTNICLDCSRNNVQKIFEENPEIKQAFKESIEEAKKPENIKKMADNTAKFMRTLIRRKK